ncbi:MAG: PAS domain-containing protein [Hyphomicrobiales bacterium]|jgi:hypothetical protein|nr:PAS domain-containing protein [Hyphomicrobiales bacterium]
MEHRTTRALYNYWRRCRDVARSTPSRADIEPSDIHGILGDTFILECDRPPCTPFRLAGTRMCLLFNRELKGADFLDLWCMHDREAIAAAFQSMRTETACHVISWHGYTESDYETGGEMILLPLTMGGTEVARALGAMVPFELPVWLGAVPLIRLGLRASHRLDMNPDHASSPPAEPAEAPSDSREQVRRVGHLSVYAGGLDGN